MTLSNEVFIKRYTALLDELAALTTNYMILHTTACRHGTGLDRAEAQLRHELKKLTTEPKPPKADAQQLAIDFSAAAPKPGRSRKQRTPATPAARPARASRRAPAPEHAQP